MMKIPTFKFKCKPRSRSFFGFCLLLALLLSADADVFAQCKYISIQRGEAVTILIPCDFPVLIETGNKTADQEKFNSEMAAWVKRNPRMANLKMSPGHVSGNFIQIPASQVIDFSPDKQREIQVKSYFYQTIK